MKLALVGATGMVGKVLLKVLEERNFPIEELFVVASKKSVGKTVSFKGSKIIIVGIEKALENKPNIAIFSAGGKISKQWAPLFAKSGTTVIDNSSAWRMDSNIKLVVPEINAKLLSKNDKIIANPNCSTIQMVLALKGVQEKYGIRRLVVSTYQSVTGTGVAALEQLNNERNDKVGKMVYPHPIDLNCLPHGGDFDENGYTTEEIKLVKETNKIFGTNNIDVTATVVRVPVIGGHSESVNVELLNDFNLEEVKEEIALIPGVIVEDDVKNNCYPMPITAQNKDAVFVGRIRRDYSIKYGLNLWIVADNLRKGAATNAVQIAEYIVDKKIV